MSTISGGTEKHYDMVFYPLLSGAHEEGRHHEKFSGLEQRAPLEKGFEIKRRFGVSKLITHTAFPLTSALVETKVGHSHGIYLAKMYTRHQYL